MSMTKIKFLTELNISGVGKNDIQILKITTKGLVLGGLNLLKKLLTPIYQINPKRREILSMYLKKKVHFCRHDCFFEILKITKDRNKKYYYATPSSFVIHGGLLRVFKRKHTFRRK